MHTAKAVTLDLGMAVVIVLAHARQGWNEVGVVVGAYVMTLPRAKAREGPLKFESLGNRESVLSTVAEFGKH